MHTHFETFRTGAALLRDGAGLPSFAERERVPDVRRAGKRLRAVPVPGCGLDRLVPFSFKGGGFCQSCGDARVSERAAHLVDEVFPDVAVRQWVLTLPRWIRHLLAWDHELWRAVVAAYLRSVRGFLRPRAPVVGVVDGRGGAIAIIQRFGAALNLNVHFRRSCSTVFSR